MSSTTLRGHMANHTGIKEYKCTLCLKEFGHKYSFRKHMEAMHWDHAVNNEVDRSVQQTLHE